MKLLLQRSAMTLFSSTAVVRVLVRASGAVFAYHMHMRHLKRKRSPLREAVNTEQVGLLKCELKSCVSASLGTYAQAVLAYISVW